MAQTYYTPYTIANGQVPSSQASYPALVVLSDARWKTTGSGGHVNNGNDVRPYSDSGLTTPLTYYKEYYDGTAGLWVGHVLITAADALSVYWGCGDSALSSDGSSTSTFPSRFKMVVNFPYGGSPTANDATSNANHMTLSNSPTIIDGPFSGGMTVNGSNQDAHITSNASIASTYAADFSIGVWVKTSANPSFGAIFDKGTGGARDLCILMDAGKFAWYAAGNDSGNSLSGTATINDGNWKFIKWTRSGSSSGFYINGSLDVTGGVLTTGNSGGDLSLGLNPSGSAANWTGSYGKFRLATGADTGNWITTEYNNFLAPNTFWTMGTEVSLGGGGPTLHPMSLL